VSNANDDRLIHAGSAAAPLIVEPKAWINRRVETIEMLSREETRRRVSVDFTLSDGQLAALATPDGIVVPISVLAKERLRAFDLRDEAGNALPVLGRAQNGELSLVALLKAVLAALGPEIADDELERLVADLRRIVYEPAKSAEGVRADFAREASVAGSYYETVDSDPTCRALLDVMWTNYVLFAVIAEGGPNRRVLKYAYGDATDLAATAHGRRSFGPGEIARGLWYPDRKWFRVECPGAWRAQSFHAEIVVPEELRIEYAVLNDYENDRPVSAEEQAVNRAALYAEDELEPDRDVAVAVEIAPEATGKLAQASATSILVMTLLWLGVASGLDAKSPDAAVSILLGGAALFSGITAVSGEHRLVSTIFSATRRWLLGVTVAALLASASLAMGVPGTHPVMVWRLAAIGCSVAALRLSWSWVRAHAYTRTMRSMVRAAREAR
jgi:hypothetical protein